MKFLADIIDGTRSWDMEKVAIGTGSMAIYYIAKFLIWLKRKNVCIHIPNSAYGETDDTIKMVLMIFDKYSS